MTAQMPLQMFWSSKGAAADRALDLAQICGGLFPSVFMGSRIGGFSSNVVGAHCPAWVLIGRRPACVIFARDHGSSRDDASTQQPSLTVARLLNDSCHFPVIKVNEGEVVA